MYVLFISIAGGVWAVIFEKTNFFSGLAVTFTYAIFSWPILLIIITYNFSVLYLLKKKKKSQIQKIFLICTIGFFYYIIFYFLPNYSIFTILKLIEFFIGWELLCVFLGMFNELSLNYIEKNNPPEGGKLPL
jgi:hypothetical protein